MMGPINLKLKGTSWRKCVLKELASWVFGEYVRSEVMIEPVDADIIDGKNFEIKNCWVFEPRNQVPIF